MRGKTSRFAADLARKMSYLRHVFARQLQLTLHRTIPLALVTPALLTTGGVGAISSSKSPPNFTLSVPASFATSVTVKRYRKGEDLLNSPPFHLITAGPMTEYHGWYGPRTAGHAWTVRVYAVLNAKAISAYAKARDGFEANLDEGREFHGLGQVATFGTFARFRRKHFRWGEAVSFLHSEYQDGPDRGAYVPDNDHLRYEVWGVTRDRQHTVVASVSVSHPKLANWPDVRVVDSIDALKRDRDYKLIETCSPDEFDPPITAFNRLVGTLKLE
jgi:hypothetical protein